MNKQYSLRPATPDDFQGILSIERAVQKAPWNARGLAAELEKPYSHFLILTDDETDSEVAGYIVFWTMLEECQILNIAVSPTLQRRGFAKQMLRKAIQIAYQNKIAKVTLDVRKSNIPAIQLYQSLFFTIVHIRKGFYSDGEDAYQMLLSLTDIPIEF